MMTSILPTAAMAGHIAVVGMTGSGKSNTGRVVVEYGHSQGEHICIFDTVKSDWHGIVSNFDGDGPGLPFQILGGPYGHVPLHPGAGAQIAEIVASGDLPYSIIDTRHFPMGGLQKFFTDFAPVLLDRNQTVLRLVFEEAHELAPKEKSGVGGESMGVYFIKKLATAGRSQGLRLMFNTQRVQALHNAALGSCGTVIAHRMQFPADQEPVVKWLKGSVPDKGQVAAIAASMSELEDGEAWVCSGLSKILERRQMPRMWTFDSGATPKQGERQRKPKVSAAVDVDALRVLIGSAVDVAASNDVGALKARIKELESAVPVKVQIPTETMEQEFAQHYRRGKAAGHQKGFIAGRDMALEQVRDLVANQLGNVAMMLDEAVNAGIGLAAPEMEDDVPAPPPIGRVSRPEYKAEQERKNVQASRMLESLTVDKHPAFSPSPSTRAIITAITGAAPMSISFDAAARRAGISKQSSAYRKYRKELDAYVAQCKGIEVVRAGVYRSTSKIVLDARPGAALDSWVAKLPPSAGAMLRVICTAKHAPDKLAIAAAAGISSTSSGVGSNLRQLIDLELIRVDGGRYYPMDGLLP